MLKHSTWLICFIWSRINCGSIGRKYGLRDINPRLDAYSNHLQIESLDVAKKIIGRFGYRDVYSCCQRFCCQGPSFLPLAPHEALLRISHHEFVVLMPQESISGTNRSAPGPAKFIELDDAYQ